MSLENQVNIIHHTPPTKGTHWVEHRNPEAPEPLAPTHHPDPSPAAHLTPLSFVPPKCFPKADTRTTMNANEEIPAQGGRRGEDIFQICSVYESD